MEQWKAACNEARASLKSRIAAAEAAKVALEEAQANLAELCRRLDRIVEAGRAYEARCQAAIGDAASLTAAGLLSNLEGIHKQMNSYVSSGDSALSRQIRQQETIVQEKQRRLRECEDAVAQAQAHYDEVVC